ncbi:MAG TPA: CHASE3 domain-containing protein, partial [Gemmatimonadales bacterium]|nr:CHASE3 domain-containing protein [Gemmatimonadales bacterium]
MRLKVNLGIALALCILCIIGGAAFWSTERFARAAEERRGSHELRIQLSKLLGDLRNAEAGQRGYLLTGKEEYLEAFTSVSTGITRGLSELLRSTQRDSIEQEQLKSLQPLIQAKLARLQQTIALRRDGRAQDATAIVTSGEGKRLMDRIQDVVAALDAGAMARTAKWDAQVRATSGMALVTIGGVSGLAVLLVLSAGLLINRGILKRSQAVAALRESESRLFQVLEALPVAVFVADADG